MAVPEVQAVIPQGAGAGFPHNAPELVGELYAQKRRVVLDATDLVDGLHVLVRPAPEVQHSGGVLLSKGLAPCGNFLPFLPFGVGLAAEEPLQPRLEAGGHQRDG